MKTGALLAAILLAVMAVAHLVRLAAGIEVLIDGRALPMWVSVLGFVIAGGVAVILWRESR